MYLTIHNQLTLLHDFLNDQVNYYDVSDVEYHHIKKLVQGMSQNKVLHPALSSVLPEIYYYGIKGESSQSMTEHIHENKENITKWIRAINETKQKISS